MATSPNRAAAARSTEPDEAEQQARSIEDLAKLVNDAGRMVAAARLENSLDAAEFCGILGEFEELVREHERAIASAPSGPAEPSTPQAPGAVVKLMTPEGADEIRKLIAKSPRTPTGKLPQGTANRIGAELGYTIGQVQSVIYSKGSN